MPEVGDASTDGPRGKRSGYRPDGRARRATKDVVRGAAAATLAVAICGQGLAWAQQMAAANLGSLSIEDLTKIEVTSVSKSNESLADAPAAIYVITHEDIVNSGATSIPEILRLAPNLDVQQANATTYAISARGFNGPSPNGPISNKLLVLIDGRTIYTALYSGVYWDMQEVPVEDIDRIEVISGPGGTLWGANAVNGVINIITRKAGDTQGGLANLGYGSLDRAGNIQYGGRAGDGFFYRVYGGGFYVKNSETQTGADARDEWHKSQGGFRIDWSEDRDALTVQGDLYDGSEEQPATPNQFIGGENLMARWTRDLGAKSSLQVQAYFDDARRFTGDNGGFGIDTYDLDVQHSFAPNDWNAVVWGGGVRFIHYDVASTAVIKILPQQANTNQGNVFVEDTISVTDSVKVIPGIKFELNPYSGLEPMPSLRASWKVNDRNLVWGAVSRSLREPTPFDRNVVEIVGFPFLGGNTYLLPEKLTAYELGYRAQPTPETTISVSTYVNDYEDLRSIEFNLPTLNPFLYFGNSIEGHSYGVETWGTWRARPWWRLMAGVAIEHENLRVRPGGSGLTGVTLASDDPNIHSQVQSTMSLGGGVTWEAQFRQSDALPNPKTEAYFELNSSLAWEPSETYRLSATANNLLRGVHVENMPQGGAPGVEVGRSLFVNLQVRF